MWKMNQARMKRMKRQEKWGCLAKRTLNSGGRVGPATGGHGRPLRRSRLWATCIHPWTSDTHPGMEGPTSGAPSHSPSSLQPSCHAEEPKEHWAPQDLSGDRQDAGQVQGQSSQQESQRSRNPWVTAWPKNNCQTAFSTAPAQGASAASSPVTTQLTWKPYSWRRSPFSSTSNIEKPLHGKRNILQTRVPRRGPPWLKQVVLPRSLEYALLVWGC